MSISVIGCGRWGTCLAWYCATHAVKDTVLLYGKPEFESFRELRDSRKNSYLELPDNIEMTASLEKTLESDIIIVSVGVQDLRGFCKELKPVYKGGKTFLLAMKGLENSTSKTISEIFAEEIQEQANIAILAGPGHVQDYLKGVPSCAVIDSADDTKEKLANLLSSGLIRFYYGQDFIGNQIGAALKNVIGLAAGILDGLGWQGLKGGLIVRAPVEVGKYIKSRGGDPFTAYALSHLGDYEATLFSPHSHNRMWGEKFAKGEEMDKTKLAEGYFTLEAVYKESKEKGIDMPIVSALYNTIYKGNKIEDELKSLFARDIKPEF